MCGITALLAIRGSATSSTHPVSIPLLRQMNAALAHRGPDDSAYAVFASGTVALGHRLLAIRDTVHGVQPLIRHKPRRVHKDQINPFADPEPGGAVPSHEYSISFNGEIYFPPETRSDLETRGHTFSTTADTEILLALYLEYGSACFARLNGEWACAIWDGHRERMILARDRYGIKPLYYALIEGDGQSEGQKRPVLAVASENKAIMLAPGFRRQFKPQYLCQTVFVFPRAFSPFQGIESVPPASFIEYGVDGRYQTHTYWCPSFPTEHNMTLAMAAEGIRKHLAKAVSRRLAGQVPVCTYLSGGVDSAAVTALAKIAVGEAGCEGNSEDNAAAPWQAFNLSFTNSDFDELDEAAKIAHHLRVDFDSVSCPAEEIAANLEATLFHTESALPNASAVGKYLLSRSAKQKGYTVTITGEGADELLGGYPTFKAEALWRMKSSPLRSERQAGRAIWKRFVKAESQTEGILWNNSNRWRTLPQRWGFPSALVLRSHLSRSLVRFFIPAKLTDPGFAVDHLDDYDDASLLKLHPLQASMVATYHTLNGYILVNLGDRLEMAHSLEGRAPFLDNDVSDFIATIPPQHLLDINTLTEKLALKEAFRGMLPVSTVEGQKHPFFAPDWLQVRQTGAGSALFDLHMSDRALRRAGMYRPLSVSIMKFLWVWLPRGSVLKRKIDIAIGKMWTVQLLWARMIDDFPTFEEDRPMRCLHTS